MIFSSTLKSLGRQVELFAGKGDSDENIHIIDDDWNELSFLKLLIQLEKARLDHVVLQFTPNMFASSEGKQNYHLVDFWRKCSRNWKTSLILHETYFRLWWYPPSWRKGGEQKRLLKMLIDSSHHIFSASQPLVEQIKGWSNKSKVYQLPIGSNFTLVPIDIKKWRDKYQIATTDIVLVLFGGGNSLKWLRGHVNAVDNLLYKNHIQTHWLLLGGIPIEWFRLKSPVILPGRLSETKISAWLQASDIFLVPHFFGLCAKRGTLMSAMLHGLPVVGTIEIMTDNFWSEV